MSAEQFAEQYRNHPKLKESYACYPWFYIGQRMEIEGRRDEAIAAYQTSVKLGRLPGAHFVRFWSEYRLGVLTGTIRPPMPQRATVEDMSWGAVPHETTQPARAGK